MIKDIKNKLILKAIVSRMVFKTKTVIMSQVR